MSADYAPTEGMGTANESFNQERRLTRQQVERDAATVE